MTLIKRQGSPHWWVDFRDHTGKRHRLSTRTASKKLALETEARLKSEATAERMLGRRPARLRTLGHVLGAYVAWAEAQNRSADRARQCAAHLEQVLGQDTSAPSLGPQHLDTYKEVRLKENAAPGTVKREIVVLVAALNHAARTGLLSANPLAGKVRQIKTQSRIRLLADSERTRLLEAATKGPGHLLLLVRLALLTGLRRNEALCLKWTSIDFDKGVLVVEKGKGGKSRVIPLSRQALELLGSVERRGEWVFADSEGRRIASVKNSWRTCCRRAGIENLTLHDLRRAFASTLAMRGVSPFLIQALLGHAQLRTSEIYVRLSEASLRGAVEACPDLGIEAKSQKSGHVLGTAPISENVEAAV